MEENNQNSGENLQASCPSCAAEEQKEQSVEVQESATQEVQRVHKHNGRNKRGVSKAQSAAQTAVCGEIQDASDFKEKLSGSHLKGYDSENSEEASQACECSCQQGEKPVQGRERRERKSRQDRRPKFDNENSEEQKPQREGPAFEKPSFKSRAVEVALDSKDFAAKQQCEQKCDFVSSVTVEEPKVGVIARIKRMFSGIFGKSEQNSAKFKKNRKDWKGKKSDKNRQFSNSKNSDFKGRKNYRHGGKRYDKNFKQPRRENSAGGNRQSDKA